MEVLDLKSVEEGEVEEGEVEEGEELEERNT